MNLPGHVLSLFVGATTKNLTGHASLRLIERAVSVRSTLDISELGFV